VTPQAEPAVTPDEQISRFTALFLDAATEAAFRADHAPQIRRVARTLTVSGVVAAGPLFCAVDYAVLPAAHPWPLILRLGVIVPVFIACGVFQLARGYPRWHGASSVVALLVLMGCVAGIGLAGGTPGRELYLASATWVPIFGVGARVSVRAALLSVLAGVLLIEGLCLVAGADRRTIAFIALNASAVGFGTFLSALVVEAGARAQYLQRRVIDAERARSERLLLNVLPAPIAHRLKSAPSVIAESVPSVTVLFADVVGFTSLSARLSPPELVTRLNELFTEFDRLAEEHGVEKIKTIGDAYMAVAGAPTATLRDPHAVADLALAMLERVRAFSTRSSEPLELRIGIHTGAAVAGVIGTKKFAYDLWGETVNTASRMESHGLPGRIQVSEATVRALGDRYAFEVRGEIDVKGIGRARTWFLVGRS
jgi:class 3 adenylate cyclase